jgi:hypothetical protein
VDFFDKDAEARQYPTKAAGELLRSALVFTVGALDTYLHDLILEIVPKCKPPYSEGLLGLFKTIAKTDSVLAFRLLSIDNKFARRREFVEALERSLSTESFLTPARLNQALEFINCRIDWQDFNEATGCDATKQLSLIAHQRNNILHRGRVATITRDEVSAAINLVGTLGRIIDDRVCKKYGIPSMR